MEIEFEVDEIGFGDPVINLPEVFTAKEPKSWFQVCKDALGMYYDRDSYAYFYGAKGQKLTKATMDALWSAGPEHFKKYSNEQREQIYRNSLNRTGYDCSGYVCKVTGEVGYSVSIYDKRTKETTIEDGFAGQFLYTTWGGTGRHIGLNFGFGWCLDMAYESTDARVEKHQDSVRLARVSDIAWEHSFQTAAVNYNGSFNKDPNGKPIESYMFKGADYACEFDPDYYYNHYKDLQKAIGHNTEKLLEHWVTFGKAESRVAKDPSEPVKYTYKKVDYTDEFDPVYYSDHYADLKKAFGYDAPKLLEHWVTFGKKEGRVAKA